MAAVPLDRPAPPAATAAGGAGQPAPEDDPGRGARALRDAFGLVAGSATLLGAFALYFGVVYTNAQSFYFGIDGSTLDLSSQDYVLRSADALFVPLGALALGGLVVLSCRTVIVGRLERPGAERARTVALWVLGPLGGALVVTAVAAVFRPLPVRTFFLFPQLSLVTGILALALAVTLGAQGGRRDRRAASVGVVLVALTVVIGVFWGASEYARALGRGRAQVLHARLPVRPGVVVYSSARLHLEGPGVVEEQLGDEGSQYRYRYAGLRLFTRAGSMYVLLPVAWSIDEGNAILLHDDERVRIELTVGRLA